MAIYQSRCYIEFKKELINIKKKIKKLVELYTP